MLDPNGRAAIDLGLYGVPETYFIDSKGKIKYRQVGPLTVKKLENIFSHFGAMFDFSYFHIRKKRHIKNIK